MDHAGSEPTRPAWRARGRRLARRIGTTIVIGVVKGMATACGAAITTWVLWWIGHC